MPVAFQFKSTYAKGKDKLKSVVLDFLAKNHCGFRKAAKKDEILANLPIRMPERTLRMVLSQLKHDGHIGSHPSLGYYFLPLTMTGPNDPEEIEWYRRTWLDMQSRAKDMLKDSSKHLDRAEKMKGADLFA